MKLKKLLPYLDALTKIRIFQNIGNESYEPKWDIVFEGYVMDIPWSLINYRLIEAENNEDSEAICPYIDGKDSCIRITLDNKERD